jgi:hypothetical protein
VTVATAPARLALRIDEAAKSIGMSRDFFDEHVRPDLRLVRRGRITLVPVVELERWLDLNASIAYDPSDK